MFHLPRLSLGALLLFPILSGRSTPGALNPTARTVTGSTVRVSANVTPNGTNRNRSAGAFTAEGYSVTNTSDFMVNMSLSCSASGGLVCDSIAGDLSAWWGNETRGVTVYYHVGFTGGTLSLIAEPDDGSGGGEGWYNITASAHGPWVTLSAPVVTSGSRAEVRSRTPRILATFRPGSAAVDTTQTIVIWKGDTVTKWLADSLTVPRHNRGVLEWEPDSTRGLNAATAADSSLLTVKVCGTDSQCTTTTRWIVLPGDSAPVLGFSALAPNSWGGGFSSPFGPGISVSGAEVETGFGTVPYFAMGAGRSTGLVYSTRQSYPRVLVPIDVELRTVSTPSYLVVRLYDGAVKLDSLRVNSPRKLPRQADS